jgi:hypothetical protein
MEVEEARPVIKMLDLFHTPAQSQASHADEPHAHSSPEKEPQGQPEEKGEAEA